jgi:hypothetical protein
MSITLTNFVRGNNLKPADFTFDDAANLIEVSVAAGSSVKTYVDSVIAALPADIYVNGLSSYNSTTNILKLSLSNGSTVDLDMTTLVADAVASVGAASETAAGIAEIATQTETNTGTDDLRFVTPLKLATYVAAQIAAASLAYATSTVAGKVTLAVASENPSTSDTEAATPAFVNAAVAAALAAQLDVFNL